MVKYSPTELIISVSKATNHEESDFEVHFLVAPPKLVKNSGKHVPNLEKVETNIC